MRNIIIILSIFLFAGCGTTKQLKEENKGLASKTATLKSEIDKLVAENSTLSTKNSSLDSSIKKLEGKNKTCAASLKTSNAELTKVKSYYSAYKAKLTKMKTELAVAFPNNLNDENFSLREDDGRLIITIPNSILYPRGSADFSSDALGVIQKLSKVFKSNQDLQILVEGHTDETPLKKGSKYKDNWDLSVARAVKIVRQFELYGVHPQRLTAAGRGYFAPINKSATEEARAMNRRTEIIIRPKIAELLKMMNELD